LTKERDPFTDDRAVLKLPKGRQRADVDILVSIQRDAAQRGDAGDADEPAAGQGAFPDLDEDVRAAGDDKRIGSVEQGGYGVVDVARLIDAAKVVDRNRLLR
jgi:hypothetical protein